MEKRRQIASVELPPDMMKQLSRMADRMHLKKSDLIRWGIEWILNYADMNKPVPIPGQVSFEDLTEVKPNG